MELKDLPDALRIPAQQHLVHTAMIGGLMALLLEKGVVTLDEVADAIDRQADLSSHAEVKNDLKVWSDGFRANGPNLTVIQGGLAPSKD